MNKTFSNLPENVIELPRKLKWSHHILKEAEENKSAKPSQYLLDWWTAHPEQDPRNMK
jgi:hypothetical protein